jgi:hypothetical protein
MQSFLQRFTGVVLGILSGFDRLVFRGRLRRLYTPEGMNHYCNANYVLRKEFKEHAKSVTAQVMKASLIAEAKRCERYRYLNSSQIDKDQVARAIANQQPVSEGLVCVLQALESCWTFDVNSVNGVLKAFSSIPRREITRRFLAFRPRATARSMTCQASSQLSFSNRDAPRTSASRRVSIA